MINNARIGITNNDIDNHRDMQYPSSSRILTNRNQIIEVPYATRAFQGLEIEAFPMTNNNISKKEIGYCEYFLIYIFGFFCGIIFILLLLRKN